MIWKKISGVVLLVMFGNANITKAQPFFSVGGGTNKAMLSLYGDSTTNILYAGGEFSQAGNIQAYAIATWNDISWDSTRNQLLYPPFDQVRSIIKCNNEIYIAGPFGFLDTSGIYGGWGVAKWDSSVNAWVDFGVNANQTVYGLYSYNNELYLMGLFDTMGGVYSSRIARYDGTNFYSFPPLDTLGGWGAINDAMFYNGSLYVGGNYGTSGTSLTEDLASYDGTQWLPVGGGLSGFSTSISAFAVYQGKLIVAGYFKTAWGDPGNSIAAWDGTSWSQLGSGVNIGIRCLTVYNGELWAGGGFTLAGGIPVTNIAKWDGTQWYSLGITLDNVVTSMAILGNDLYIGGAFWTMNGDSVHRIIRYNYLTGFESLEPKENEIEIYPNPTSSTLNIKIFNSFKLKNISIYNTLGEKVKIFKPAQHNRHTELVEVFIGDLPKGLYLVQLRNDAGITYTQKVILE